MAKNKIKNSSIFKSIFAVILFVYIIILLSMFFFAFYTSCKDVISDFTFNQGGLPQKWIFTNYTTIFKELKMEGKYYLDSMFIGSILYSVMCSFSFVIATTLMAYACVYFKCKMSNIIYFLVLFMIVVPIVGSYPSEYRIVTMLNINKTILGAFWFKFTFGNIYFLIITEGFKAIPNDFNEAAQVDGASLFRIMFQIIIPMCLNILGSVFIITFVSMWNDYNTPLLYFTHFPNIALGLLYFSWQTSGKIADAPFKMGACFIVLIPILILFAFFQKTLLGSLAAGGVKG